MTEENLNLIWKKRMAWFLLVQLLFFAIIVFFSRVSGIEEMPFYKSAVITMDAFGILILTMIFMSNVNIKEVTRFSSRFLLIIAITTFFLFFDAITWIIDGDKDFAKLSLIINTCYYIITIVLAWMLWYFFAIWVSDNPKNMHKTSIAVDIISIIGILAILGNTVFGYYFTISPDGVYVRSETYPLCIIPSALLLIIFIITVFKTKMKLTTKFVFLSYPLFPYLGNLLTLGFSKINLTAVLMFCSVILLYCNIFIRQESELATKQAELAQQKVNSMLMQINPHFIYNTLGSVASLCTDDPEKAKDILYSFSNYLRENLGEMTHKSLIPFEREMEHLNYYIKIEKMRFPDIEIVLDLKATSFSVPPLTVQPLVENAITHGIMGREQGGKITISSYEDKTNYYISIEDDGVGFSDIKKNDGKNHIGINNVNSRLEMLCKGKLLINSTVGVGTYAEISIPKEAK